MLVHCLSSVGLTELNSFLVLPPLLHSVSSNWPILVCLGPQEPRALEALCPSDSLGDTRSISTALPDKASYAAPSSSKVPRELSEK